MNKEEIHFDVYQSGLGVNLYRLDENGRVIDARLGLGAGKRRNDLRSYICNLFEKEVVGEVVSNDPDLNTVCMDVYLALEIPAPVMICRNGVCNITSQFFDFTLARALNTSYDGLMHAVIYGITDLWDALELADRYLHASGSPCRVTVQDRERMP